MTKTIMRMRIRKVAMGMVAIMNNIFLSILLKVQRVDGDTKRNVLHRHQRFKIITVNKIVSSKVSFL